MFSLLVEDKLIIPLRMLLLSFIAAVICYVNLVLTLLVNVLVRALQFDQAKKEVEGKEGTEKRLNFQPKISRREEGHKMRPLLFFFLKYFHFIFGRSPDYSPKRAKIFFILTAKMVNALCSCMPNRPRPGAASYPWPCFNSLFFASILYRSLA